MVLFLTAAATFAATMFGGLLALRLRDRLHLILGFSAGAVVSLAFFELLPEAIELSSNAALALSFAALGFFLYLLLDRFLLLQHAHTAAEHAVAARGSMRAGSFSVHSFLDGVGIGLSFQVSPELGALVAAAVLSHDFSDGINTVSVVIRHGGDRARALRWLVVDALAPVAGIASTLLFSVGEGHLALLLAMFGGFFLYIGASDLIPESHHAHPKFLTTVMTFLGALVLFIATQLAG